MSSNFNLVKKPKKEDIEIEEEEDVVIDDDDSKSSSKSKSSGDDPKRKMFLLMGIIVGVTILLLIILYIASLFSHRNYTYEEVEDIMRDAAISYFNDNPSQLPANEGDVVIIDSSNLVAAGKMKALNEYYESDAICTGNVQVQKSGDNYLYAPYLNCGDYVTLEFYKKVLQDNEITKSGEGLYSTSKAYAFRGEKVNNYVKLDKSVWRIVKITDNNDIVLISDEGLLFSQPWDNRYNEERLYESGINNYNLSRIKTYLERIYTNPVETDGEDILSDKDKSRTVSFDVCVGSRTTTSEGKSNGEECKQKVKDQKIALLTLSDYLYASLDTNCKSASTRSCMNYNYLTYEDEWWLVTANSENTSTVFKVERDGNVKADITSSYSDVRPVIYLNSRTMYASGKGTKDDPYVLR